MPASITLCKQLFYVQNHKHLEKDKEVSRFVFLFFFLKEMLLNNVILKTAFNELQNTVNMTQGIKGYMQMYE